MHERWNRSERELRFLLTRPQAEQFLTQIATRVALADHHRRSPVAYTRTTYFDSEDQELFRSCTGTDPSIVARRVRIREYAAAPSLHAPALLTGDCFLELKESRGPSRRKLRFAAPPARIWGLVSCSRRKGPYPLDALSRNPDLGAVEHRIRLGDLRPTLTTWYRRWSLHAQSAPIRITFDEGLAYGRIPECARDPDARACAAGQPAEPQSIVAFGPSRVIEVKYRGLPPAWLVDAIADLPTRSRTSKFVMGTHALAGSGDIDQRMGPTRPLKIPGRIPFPAA